MACLVTFCAIVYVYNEVRTGMFQDERLEAFRF